MYCHGCAQVATQPELQPGQQVSCARCGHFMQARHSQWERRVLALTITGLLLFIMANVFPFMALEQAGQTQNTNLISGVQALIARSEFLLAALVFISIFLFPLLELLGIAYVMCLYGLNIRGPYIGQVLHLLKLSEPWSMLEIFLLGVLVSSVKLAGMAILHPGAGFYTFLMLVVVLLLAHRYIDRKAIWAWLDPNNHYDGAGSEELCACTSCDALITVDLIEQDNRCPRCEHYVYRRWPRSAQKSFALLLAASVLYIPSNTLPMMITTELGYVTVDTIFSGVLHLADSGDLPIAIIVFVASIIIPIVKIMVMGYLLLFVSGRIKASPKKAARVFQITEFVGRWSMIDVFVVTVLVALVQFDLLANVEPGSALLCFAAVVVLTMMAAASFDPKLIWDAAAEPRRAEPKNE